MLGSPGDAVVIGYRDGEMYVICHTCGKPVGSPIAPEEYDETGLTELATSETLCHDCAHKPASGGSQ